MDSMDRARDQLVFALDLDDADEAMDVARSLRGALRWMKVATRLYTTVGPRLVGDLRDLGFEVFLDLKFHDIPDQVEGACRAAAKLGVGMMTVHASGGPAMLAAAARGARAGSAESGAPASKVLAVTVLTSLDAGDLSAVGVQRPLHEQVLALARLTDAAGCAGVVASPQELGVLRSALPRPFGILTPGIRPRGTDAFDQKRVTTPADAVRGGADWLVVGRPIKDAPDRGVAARAILREIAGAQGAV